MRKIEYLSPSAFMLYKKDKEAYYKQYLSDKRLPRDPQTEPMAVGSSFDAYAKSHLNQVLYGRTDPKFDFSTLFEAQVEKHNRAAAYDAGRHCFDQYTKHGALADLLLELQNADGTASFESELRGVVKGERETEMTQIGGVVLLGKPDILFKHKELGKIVFDWKVNGYYSKWNVSPQKGYVRLRPDGSAHKEAFVQMIGGCRMNMADTLENINEDWATQLTIYAWLDGTKIGEPITAWVDQLVCKPNTPLDPIIRVAEHRLRIGQDFQYRLFRELSDCWDIIHSDHYFRECTKTDSQNRCQIIDNMLPATPEDALMFS